VSLERGPLSFANTIEELIERKSSGSGLESREYGRRYPSRWPRGILYRQKLALTSPTSGGRSVGIVHSRTQATEFSLLLLLILYGPFVGPWTIFQFLDPMQNSARALGWGSACRIAAAYTRKNRNRINIYRYLCLERDSNPVNWCLIGRRVFMLLNPRGQFNLHFVALLRDILRILWGLV
jgi:hypothetical protein